MPDRQGRLSKALKTFVVRDLIIKLRIIRYRRERWQNPNGQTLVVTLPPEVISGSHFGPNLMSCRWYCPRDPNLTTIDPGAEMTWPDRGRDAGLGLATLTPS